MLLGDHGQSSIFGTDYIPVVHGDKFRGNDTAYFDGEKTHGVARWDTVLESTTKLHNDPSLVSFPSIPSSSMRNVFEQEHTTFSDLLTGKRDLTEEAENSHSFQSSWQVQPVICIVYLPVVLYPSASITACLFSSFSVFILVSYNFEKFSIFKSTDAMPFLKFSCLYIHCFLSLGNLDHVSLRQ